VLKAPCTTKDTRRKASSSGVFWLPVFAVPASPSLTSARASLSLEWDVLEIQKPAHRSRRSWACCSDTLLKILGSSCAAGITPVYSNPTCNTHVACKLPGRCAPFAAPLGLRCAHHFYHSRGCIAEPGMYWQHGRKTKRNTHRSARSSACACARRAANSGSGSAAAGSACSRCSAAS